MWRARETQEQGQALTWGCWRLSRGGDIWVESVSRVGVWQAMVIHLRPRGRRTTWCDRKAVLHLVGLWGWVFRIEWAWGCGKGEAGAQLECSYRTVKWSEGPHVGYVGDGWRAVGRQKGGWESFQEVVQWEMMRPEERVSKGKYSEGTADGPRGPGWVWRRQEGQLKMRLTRHTGSGAGLGRRGSGHDMEGEDSSGSKLMGQGRLAERKFRRFGDRGQLEKRDQGC